MKLSTINPVFDTTGGGPDIRALNESASDFFQRVIAKLRAGKLDPEDNETKNTLAMVAVLMFVMRRMEQNKISPEQLRKIIKNVTASGSSSNMDLDLLHLAGGNREIIQTRDDLIQMLMGSNGRNELSSKLSNLQNNFHNRENGFNRENAMYH